MNSLHCLISDSFSNLRLFHASIFQTYYEYIMSLLELLKLKHGMRAFLCFYKVKKGMFKKLLHDPRHSFCNLCHNLLVLDKRQRKTSYFIRPVLRPTFRKEQVSYHGGRGNA